MENENIHLEIAKIINRRIELRRELNELEGKMRRLENKIDNAKERALLTGSPISQASITNTTCPFFTIRKYPACYEDCPDTDECPKGKPKQ